MSLPQRIAFIGGGNMASAIMSGLRSLGAECPQISVCDVVPAIRERHAAAGLTVYESIESAVDSAELVVLAIKPQGIADLLPELAAYLQPEQALVSILAGTTCARLESGLPSGSKVVRAMPNTPMAIAQGMVGLCAGKHAEKTDLEMAEAVFAPAAKVLVVEESRMDAITAVSGSGPAYVFAFCEAFQAAAQALGFSEDEARLLVSQTVSGATAYLCQGPDFPAGRLREQVTSPGGTTAAALAVWNEHDVAATLRDAVAAAAARGAELAQS